MNRIMFVLLSVWLNVILATEVSAVLDCRTVRCAGVPEDECPGIYTPADLANGKCCSSCLVTKGIMHFHYSNG
jgi:hypothetical protein